MDNIKDYILEISRVENESAINVMEALYGAYDKMFMIEDNYNGEYIEGFSIFQEGKIMDDVKEQGKNMSTVGKILSLLPRLVISLYRAITGKLNKDCGTISVSKSTTRKKKGKAINKKKLISGASAVGFAAVAAGTAVVLRKKLSKSGKKDEFAIYVDQHGEAKYVGYFKIELFIAGLDMLNKRILNSMAPDKPIIKIDKSIAIDYFCDYSKEGSGSLEELAEGYNEANEMIKKISENFKMLSGYFKTMQEEDKYGNADKDKMMKYKKLVESVSADINEAVGILGMVKKCIGDTTKLVDESLENKTSASEEIDNDSNTDASTDETPASDDNRKEDTKKNDEKEQPEPETKQEEKKPVEHKKEETKEKKVEDKPVEQKKEEEPKDEKLVQVPDSEIMVNMKWFTKGSQLLSTIKSSIADYDYNKLDKIYEKTINDLESEDIDMEDAFETINQAFKKYLYVSSKLSTEELETVKGFLKKIGYNMIVVKPGAKCKEITKYFDGMYSTHKGATPENDLTVKTIDDPPFIFKALYTNERGQNDQYTGILPGSMVFYKFKK